jgi:hypothetical protein
MLLDMKIYFFFKKNNNNKGKLIESKKEFLNNFVINNKLNINDNS